MQIKKRPEKLQASRCRLTYAIEAALDIDISDNRLNFISELSAKQNHLLIFAIKDFPVFIHDDLT